MTEDLLSRDETGSNIKILENASPGLYTQEGRLLFQSPPKDAIDKWKKVDSRITYFRFRLPSSDQDKDSEQEPEIAVHVSEKDQVTYPASEESLRFY